MFLLRMRLNFCFTPSECDSPASFPNEGEFIPRARLRLCRPRQTQPASPLYHPAIVHYRKQPEDISVR